MKKISLMLNITLDEKKRKIYKQMYLEMQKGFNLIK